MICISQISNALFPALHITPMSFPIKLDYKFSYFIESFFHSKNSEIQSAFPAEWNPLSPESPEYITTKGRFLIIKTNKAQMICQSVPTRSSSFALYLAVIYAWHFNRTNLSTNFCWLIKQNRSHTQNNFSNLRQNISLISG